MGSFTKIIQNRQETSVRTAAPSGTFTKISTGEIIRPKSVQPHPSQPAAVPPSPSGEGFTPAGGTEKILRSAADDMWNRGSRYSGAGSSGLAEARQDRLRKLEARRSELTAGLDLEGAAALDNEINSLRKQLGRTFPQQAARTVSGMAKAIPAGLEGFLGSTANAWTSLYQVGQAARDTQNREYLQEYTDGLEQSRIRLDAMLRDNSRSPGTWSGGDIESQQNIVNDWQRKYDAMSKVVGEDIQRQATRESYGVADALAADSARRLEEAKQGVAAPGRVLIDATGSLVQNVADMGVNALLSTPGSMGSFAMRAFGGGAQQARQEMEAMGTADQEGAFEKQLAYGLSSMAKEIATEKMFGLSAPFGAAYGKGSLDDLAQDAVNRAVSRFAGTAAGKRALERGLNFVNSAASEGLEELIGDWMEWQLPRIYGGEVDPAREVLENSLYDFLVGAASGGLGDVTYRGAGRALDAVTGNTARSTGEQFREMGEDAVQANVEAIEAESAAEQPVQQEQAPAAQGEKDALMRGLEAGRIHQTELTEEQVGDWDAHPDVWLDAGDRVYQMTPEEHIDQRTPETVGSRKVMAFQFDHPELHNYFSQAARSLADDLASSVPGERWSAEVYNPESGAYETKWMGQKRAVSDAVAYLLDDQKLSYADIEKSLDAIINDNGQENYAAAKRVELVLDDMLTNGYTTVDGQRIAPDQAYIDAKSAYPGSIGAEARAASDTFEELPLPLDVLESPETARAKTNEMTRQSTQGRTEAQRALDAARVKRASSALGENGKKALTAAYDGQTGAQEYYGGFSAYYQAGVSGQDIGKVSSDYGQYLTPAQQYAAYSAGKNDAALSLKREKEAAKFAPVAGEKSGLVYDDFVRQAVESGRTKYLTAETADRINTLAKDLGVRVRFVDSVAGGVANAQIKGSEVLVERNNKNPVMTIVGHELTHRMQELAPEEYRAFREYVAQDSAAMSTVESMMDLYARQGVPLTYEGALDEVTADYAGELFESSKALDRFIRKNQDNRTLLEKLRDAFRALWQKLTGKEKQQAGEAEKKLTAALEAAAAQAEQNRKSAAQTEGVETRFSLKSPVEETKNLLALHNLNEEKLLKSLKLGGFPMPSIAITKSNIPHTNFGDISMVFGKETVDPKFDRRNTVYSADAWTPTFPQIEYEVDKKVESRLRNKFYELSRKYGREAVDALYPWGNYAHEELTREGGEAAVLSKLKDNTDMMKVYLLDSEMQVPDTVMAETVTRLDDDKIRQYDYFIDGLGKDVIGEIKAADDETPMAARRRWIDAHGEELENVYRGYLRDAGGLSETEIENVMDNPSFSARSLLREVVVARRYLENGPETKTTSIDTDATRRAIREATDQEAYQAWLQDLFGGIEKSSGIYNWKERYTSSGNLRSFKATHFPVTLDNIAKAMAAEGDVDSRNVSGFYGVKSLRAGMAKRFSSIDDMHQMEGRLKHLTEEEAGQITDALGERLTSIMEKVYATKAHSKYDNQFTAYDNIGNLLMDACRAKKITIDSIIKEFSGTGYTISTPLAAEIRDLLFDVAEMPVNIFEAKPERAVRFDEVLAAVIPDSASQELRDGLSDAGVRTLEYKEGDDADRLAKVNSVEGARFSLKGEYDLLKETRRLEQQARREGWTDARLRQERRNAVDRVYNALLQEYGAISPGEKPARNIQVPKKTSDTEKVSQTVRTILEAKATPEDAIPDIQELVAKGDFSYETITDKEAIAKAESTITDKSWGTVLGNWKKDMAAGKVSKDNTALGWALYNNAANSGNLDVAMDVLQDMVRHQRNAAQALQATRILKKLSPEGQLYGVVKSVEGLQKDLNERYGDKKSPELKIDPELGEKLLNAKDQKERDAALRDIYRDIGRQMPSRFIDKWNAWRYLSMLGNPRTHVRNIVGNAGFAPVVAAKDMTATAIEAAVSAVSGGRLDRSKGFVGLGKKGRALLSAAWSDYANVAEAALGGGKYDDLANANKYIEEGRIIFKGVPAASKALEAARKANSYALDKEDMWFSQPHYAYAMAQFCAAHKITEAEIRKGNPQVLAAARNYAVKEAQKATYRDTNALSQTISNIGRPLKNSKNPVSRGLGIAIEGILPFRKTPANILARGLEYSPLGLAKGLSYDLAQVKQGKMTGAAAIDNISAGLTGTGLLALGVYLAAEGLVRGGGSGDDKEKEMEKLQGHQDYSLELPGGTSVTLDWLAPEALPFFVGVNLWETMQSEGGATLSDALAAVSNVSDPMLEMSCLQSLNDALDVGSRVYSSGGNPITSVLSGAATNYLTQGLPTIFGQAERSFLEEERETTYTEKNAFLTSDMQYTLGKISGKIPGWDYQQIPYIDAWERHESSGAVWTRAFNNFLNPAYTSQIEESPVEKELLRLYQQTGDGGVLPKRAGKSFTVNGEQRDLSAQEYVKYAENRGQTSLKLVTALTENKLYDRLDDGEKAECIGDAYTYANQTARAKIDSGANMDSWVTKAQNAQKRYNVPVDAYIIARNSVRDIEGLKDKNGESIPNSKGLLVMQKVYGIKGLNDAQRSALFADFGVGKTVIGYNRAAVDEALERMKKQTKK